MTGFRFHDLRRSKWPSSDWRSIFKRSQRRSASVPKAMIEAHEVFSKIPSGVHDLQPAFRLIAIPVSDASCIRQDRQWSEAVQCQPTCRSFKYRTT